MALASNAKLQFRFNHFTFLSFQIQFFHFLFKMAMKLGFINWENTSILSHLLVFTFHAYFWNKQKYWGLKKIPKATQGTPLPRVGATRTLWPPPPPSPYPCSIPAKSRRWQEPHKGEKKLPLLDRPSAVYLISQHVNSSRSSRYLQPSSCWGTSGRVHAGFGSMRWREGWKVESRCVICASQETSGTRVGGRLEKGSYSRNF